MTQKLGCLENRKSEDAAMMFMINYMYLALNQCLFRNLENGPSGNRVSKSIQKWLAGDFMIPCAG